MRIKDWGYTVAVLGVSAMGLIVARKAKKK